MRVRFVAALGLAAVALSVAATGGATALSRTTGATALSPSGPGGTWGPVTTLPGDHGFATRAETGVTISCATVGNCGDIIWETAGPLVVNEVNGVWGKPEDLPGFAAIAAHFESGGSLAISCTAPGDCAAGGSYQLSGGGSSSFVAAETNGSWGKTQAIPGLATLAGNSASRLESLSCGSPGNCAAVGAVKSHAGLTVPFTASEVNGVWGSAQVPDFGKLDTSAAASLTVVSCASAGNCGAGGYADGTGTATHDAVVIDESSGTWGKLTPVPGISTAAKSSSIVTAISCGAPGDCAVGGKETGGVSYVPFVADETTGTWQKATADPGMAALTVYAGTVSSVSCSAAGACAASGAAAVRGASNATYFVPFAVGEVSGTWGVADTFAASLTQQNGYETGSADAVACASAGNCTAAGQYARAGKLLAFTAAETDGVWGTASALPGAAASGASSAGAIACPAAGYCSVSGDGVDAFVADEATVSATGLRVSPIRATYGNEQGLRLTATVTSPVAGTPEGTVTVTRGRTPVCVIVLTGGTGSCTLAKTALPVGSSVLAGEYSGDVTFVDSVSPGSPVTVVKAPTKTTFTLAKAAVKVGHEAAERFTVAVSPRYAGLPSGRVLIKLGKTTVAAMTLQGGKGSYTLSARQFKPGTYRLVATYAGDADYVSSSSPARTLTVGK